MKNMEVLFKFKQWLIEHPDTAVSAEIVQGLLSTLELQEQLIATLREYIVVLEAKEHFLREQLGLQEKKEE